MKNKKVLITGGLGFIGSNLAHTLVNQGAQVTIFDAKIKPYGFNEFNIADIRDKVQVIKGDVRSQKDIKPHIKHADYVYHLAGQVGRMISMEDPFFDLEVNCIGTLNILELVRKYNPSAKILFAGSRGEMGNPLTLPVDEKSLPLPTDIYGANKLVAEHYLRIYHNAYDLQTVTFRINNVYGPRCQMKSSHYGIVNLFLYYVFTGKEIPVFGKGLQTRDYFYIDDLTDAFLVASLSDKANGKVYFVGSGQEIKFIDMVKTIISVMGKGSYRFEKYPEVLEKIDTKRFNCSIEAIKKDLGWKPKVALADGIEKTMAYYKKYLSHYE